MPADSTECTDTPDRMPALVTRFQADRESLDRLFSAPGSPRRRARFTAFYQEWQQTLDRFPFAELSAEDRADWILLRHLIESELRLLDRDTDRFVEMTELIPFAPDLIALEDERRQLLEVCPESVAERLDGAAEQLQETRKELERRKKDGDGPRPTVAMRAAGFLDRLRKSLKAWHGHYAGYDPLFTWWIERPYEALTRAMDEYAGFLRKDMAGAEDEDAIIGDPIGREALLEELARNLIPYSPEELIAIAGREMAWCLAEARRASNEMGCGEDWRAALEQVKRDHVPPGEQPALVRDLARDAVRFVTERDLVTVPPLAEECWRLEMMPPEKQKVNPFFLGGEVIQVSFPTAGMEHAQKRMALRGNNRHFARATVQHELIPGHHLQGFSQDRYRPYRRIFYTPFWTEGWTLHWEMLLWELGFAQSPEDRLGMLFWRMHRCARVLFSLGFHMGEMTADECVEMLVNDVGHERDNALAEVRRSFGGDYDPLYQLAYLIGGLQVHALHRELVTEGAMTQREFHDGMLHENCMPIAVLRALLRGDPLDRDFQADWRFDSDPAIHKERTPAAAK